MAQRQVESDWETVKSDENQWETVSAEPMPMPKPERLPAVEATYGTRLREGLKEAGKVLFNTMPEAATGMEPTDVPWLGETGNAILNTARNAFGAGIPGPKGLTLASGAKAVLRASPAVETAVAVGNVAKAPVQALQSTIKRYADRPREPVTAMTQALKPLSTNLGFGQAVEKALPYLKQTEAQLGKPIEGVEDLGAAVKIAKKQFWSQYQKIAGPQAERGVDASSVADAIEKSISLKTRLQNPAEADKLMRLADTYRSRPFKLGELDDLLTTGNAELSAYYGKYPAAKITAVRANPEIAHTAAETDALRDLIYDQLDKGTASKELKGLYGSMMNIEKEVQRRLNVAARQNPESLSEQISQWGAAMKLGKAAITFPARPIGALGDVASAYAGRQFATALKEANTSDALIANAFRNYKGVPAPIATAPLRATRGLLEGGPIMTPPPADTSFVKGTPANLARTPLVRRGMSQLGAALPTSDRFLEDAIAARMNQFTDMVRQGATEMTGKTIREEGGGIVGRHKGGTAALFPEFKNFSEAPSDIAAAIERGHGALYERIKKAIADAVSDIAESNKETEFGFGANVAETPRARAIEALRARRSRE